MRSLAPTTAQQRRQTKPIASALPRPAAAPRTGSKQAQLIELLRRPEGVSVREAATALAWQPHSIRGAFAGSLKKKLGLTLTVDKSAADGARYRIAEGQKP